MCTHTCALRCIHTYSHGVYTDSQRVKCFNQRCTREKEREEREREGGERRREIAVHVYLRARTHTSYAVYTYMRSFFLSFPSLACSLGFCFIFSCSYEIRDDASKDGNEEHSNSEPRQRRRQQRRRRHAALVNTSRNVATTIVV